ncbi:DNA excision repair protein ERCC-5 [Salmo salar]|uniref:DNA excision repair protein ERCC-5 n=1 Tax=Salmo salar TaxID=8030 RepID=A0ABM3E876_SALSA|nr:DNA excision repair protein ERCC-5 [Salmo salar]
MGVHGLWKLLETTGKPINPETLEGKILAVDISIWLNQAVKGVRDREGNSIQNAHLLTLFHRLCKLLFFRIRPVFVFDGDAPLIKKQTLAIRRQRKEEKTMESKQTNDKLLKTFLKRQAIKAALGERSQDHLPSLSAGRREEDMYILPALPAQEEERERSSSEQEEEDSRHIYQGDFYEDSVDINSEEFSAMPPEVKHEILKDMKEFSKRRRTMYHTPPERSGDFSQYQLAGLLQRNKLNVRLEGVEREMSNRSAGNAPGVELYNQGEGHSVETRRLLSEDSTHYILIKGPKKTDNSERVPDIQPAASPWLGGPLSGRVRTGGGEKRPEPLWKPISEEESLEEGPSSSSKHPQDTNPSLGDTAPTSPRTLKAIQAAMDSSFSDEDEEDSSWGRGGRRAEEEEEDSSWGRGGRRADEEGAGGSVSPRTLLAIQRAIGEELEVGPSQYATMIGNSPVKPHSPSPQRPANRLVVISSSQEETEGKDTPLRTTLTNEDRLEVKGDEQQSPLPLSLPIPPTDRVLLGREEQDETATKRNREEVEEILRRNREEVEQAIDNRNRAFHSAVGQGDSLGQDLCVIPPSGLGLNREKDTGRRSLLTGPLPPSQQERNGDNNTREERNGQNTREERNGQNTREERNGQNTREERNGENTREERNGQNTREERNGQNTREERNGQNTREERNGQIVKMEDGEEDSDSESFIDVSEGEELNEEEETDDSPIEVGGGAPSKAQEDVANKKEEEEEALSSRAIPLEEREEEEEPQPPTETSPALPAPASVPLPNEWEDINVDELVALESSLGEQQSSLREQKQQQERIAATVTGQMCLESQELLRLFGVPFLVAPGEAEAQCAALDRTDQTHGTITDDSDVWLFGGRHVYKNFFSQNKYVEYYQYVDLQNQLGVDRTKLINLAYLLGSDYTEGVPGVGYVTGMEILNEFPGPGTEPVRMFSEWWSSAQQQQQRLNSDPRDSKVKRKLRGLQLRTGFPDPAVATAYLQPSVDLSESSFSWGRPHLDLLKEFCESRFGWNSRKTEETLHPVLKQLSTQQTQLRIDSFFRLEQQERQAIKSQRLRRAVTCIKRKEREDGGREEREDGGREEEEEEGTGSPSKAKRGKGSEPKQRKGEVEEGSGGFLGAEVSKPVQEDMGRTSHDVGVASQERKKEVGVVSQNTGGANLVVGGASQQRKEVPPPNNGVPKLLPSRTEQSGGGNSGDDSDGDSGVAMVTAQSVFGGQPREGRGGRRGKRGVRGRGRGRGRKTL